jgi:hypothetical protein
VLFLPAIQHSVECLTFVIDAHRACVILCTPSLCVFLCEVVCVFKCVCVCTRARARTCLHHRYHWVY